MQLHFRKIEMKNEWLRGQLERAGEALDMLKIDNRGHNELIQRHTKIMQEYFDLKRSIVEMSAEKEKLKKKNILLRKEKTI